MILKTTLQNLNVPSKGLKGAADALSFMGPGGLGREAASRLIWKPKTLTIHRLPQLEALGVYQRQTTSSALIRVASQLTLLMEYTAKV